MSIRVSVLAAAVLAATPALAIDLPPRKPGLWETRAVIKGRYKVIRRCFRQGERSAFVDTVGIDACTRSTQKPLLLEGYRCRPNAARAAMCFAESFRSRGIFPAT
ncbi:hypothetical protein [Chenggangzhangella methanolivorans]|uniref:UrcA family protein n=1 Tax=Chenggangzhangella methanolivorans TaxID=1437009 RepID=A0A9E6RCH3_9HYPH|nr:hypothetical protein [Chenggangzhangella methanolivorans]QZO01320.1 hypothetical protein K6K41_07450 [Chenggangzhangella methanolivorans]